MLNVRRDPIPAHDRKFSPPVSRNRPKTESDFTNRQVSVFVSAKTHGWKLNFQYATLKIQRCRHAGDA